MAAATAEIIITAVTIARIILVWFFILLLPQS